MNIKLYKYINGQNYDIDIANIREGDLIQELDLDTNEYVPNKDGKFISIIISDAIFNEEDKSWTIYSKPYTIEEGKH